MHRREDPLHRVAKVAKGRRRRRIVATRNRGLHAGSGGKGRTGDVAYAQAALAPSTFGMRARNAERDLEIGGDRMMFCAVQGPPFVRKGDERRDGTLADFDDLLRLVQMDPNLDTPGRNVLEPNDIALDARHLMRALAMIRLTDRVWAGEPSSGEAAADCLRMAEIVHDVAPGARSAQPR